MNEARFRNRLNDLDAGDPVQSLRETIAIARLLVEKRLNLITTDVDLMMAYSDLNALQLTIERLVKSTTSIQNALDALISKPLLLRLGQHIIQITAEEVQDPIVTEQISEEIFEAIAEASNTNQVIKHQRKQDPRFLISNGADKARLAELVQNDSLLALNEDIGVQIVLIERRYDMITDDMSLIRACPDLNASLRVLEKLITTAHTMSQNLGQLLNVQTVQRIGQRTSEILESHLKHLPNFEDMTDRIMDRLVASFQQEKKLLAR